MGHQLPMLSATGVLNAFVLKRVWGGTPEPPLHKLTLLRCRKQTERRKADGPGSLDKGMKEKIAVRTADLKAELPSHTNKSIIC